MSSDIVEPVICQNCGNRFAGQFCNQCGQKSIGENDRHFRQLVGEYFNALTSLDGRFLRSMGALVFKPGLLAREYFRGRRIYYLSPISIFLLINVLYFLSPPLTDFNIPFEDQMSSQQYSGWLTPMIRAHIVENGLNPSEVRESYNQRVHELAKSLIIVHVPFLALLLMAAFHNRQLLYADHFVVGLHMMSFLLLYSIALSQLFWPALRWLDGETGGWLSARFDLWKIMTGIQYIYVPFLCRVAYGASWLRVLVLTPLVLIGLYWVHVGFRLLQFGLVFSLL